VPDKFTVAIHVYRTTVQPSVNLLVFIRKRCPFVWLMLMFLCLCFSHWISAELTRNSGQRVSQQ